MTEIKTFEELKKEHFDWIDNINNDFYVVNENNNYIIKNDDKPIKLDIDNDDFKTNYNKFKYLNACHTFKCDIKFIIPFKLIVNLDENNNIAEKFLNETLINKYLKDINRGITNRKYYINNTLKNDTPDQILQNLLNPITINNSIPVLNDVENGKILKNLDNFLFGSFNNYDYDDIRIKNIFPIFNQDYDHIIYIIFRTICNNMYVITSGCENPEQTIFINNKELIFEEKFSINIFEKQENGILDIKWDENGNNVICENKFITILTYIDFTKKNPDYYIKLIFNDKYKYAYRKNSLTFEEEEAIKNKKILFI